MIINKGESAMRKAITSWVVGLGLCTGLAAFSGCDPQETEKVEDKIKEDAKSGMEKVKEGAEKVKVKAGEMTKEAEGAVGKGMQSAGKAIEETGKKLEESAKKPE